MKMNLRHLRTFVAIVDAGGIHRAATRLHLTQPAASRQVQALEVEFGVLLFDRIGRRLHLTSEGEELLRRSRRLLAEAQSLSERASALRKGDTGILRVGATPMVIENTLSGFISQWRSRHPAVDVQLIEDGGIALPRRLDHGEIHFGIMAVDELRFRFRLLYPVHGLAVVAKEHRFGRRHRTIDVADLMDERLMLLRGEYASRDWFDTACRVARIQPRVLLESGSPHALIALAASGYGVAVVPSTVVIPRERVRGIPLTQSGAALGRWLRLVWEPQRFLATYAETFAKDLVVYCRRSYPGDELDRRIPQLPRPKESSG
jgi:LysR family transcriptional regulator, cyn operon transcriptional activator